MNTASQPVDLREALTSYTNAIQMINGRLAVRIALRTSPRQAITTALATIPHLCLETEHLRATLRLGRLDHANLVAAARATLRADRDGESDALWYLRDELDARGQLPADPGRRA